MHRAAFAFTLLLAAASVACERKEPPAPLGTPASASTSATVTSTASAGASSFAAGSSSAKLDDAGVDAAGEVADAAVPDLLAPDGGALPQTQETPSLESPSYKVRVAHLWRAIVEDKPELADDAFFPVLAYQQVKAVAKPEIDYERRLLAAYHRDLHAYHKKLGPKPEEARFVELAVPAAKATWVKPGEEYNKLGYYRVFNSKLRFQRADGKEGSLLVLSLISWRGEWYVVHVAGIK